MTSLVKLLCTNSVPIGYEAEVRFPLLCWQQGWDLAKATFETSPYDFLVKGVDDDGNWKTAQIKKSYRYKNRDRVNLRKRGSNSKQVPYEDDDFDYLFVFRSQTAEWYRIPYGVVKHIKTEIVVSNKKWDLYKI